MASLTIRSIWAKNFRSIVKPIEIEFPNQGLVLLKGASGVGKSTINLILSYAFGFNSFPATQLQSWETDEVMEVGVRFSTDTDECTLVRGKSLTLTIDGVKQEGSKKHIEDTLQKIIGLSPEMLGALTYRPQQEPGTFLKKNDQEKKEFLSELLGVGKFERSAEVTQETIKNLTTQVTVAENLLLNHTIPDEDVVGFEELTHQKQLLNQSIQDTKDLVSQIEQSIAQNVSEQQKKVVEHQRVKASDPRLQELNEASKEIQALIIDLQRQDQEQSKTIREAEQRYQKEASSLKVTVSRLNGYRRDLESALNNQCPTCEQSWITQTDFIADLRQKIGIAEQAEFKLTQLVIPEPFRSNPEIDALRSKVLKIPNMIAKENERLDDQKQMDLVDLSNQKLNQEKERAGRLEQITSYQTSLSKYQHQIEVLKFNQRQIELCKAKKVQLEQALAELKTKLHAEQDFLALVGRTGFLGSIFEEVLLEISDETSNILRMLPNCSTVTIEFKTESTTLKGTTKRSIVPFVSVRGHSLPLDAALSGGMRTAVRLAVDIAVNTVVSRRTGVRPRFMLLDEVADGLDTESREALVEMLQHYAKDCLVVLVDHDAVMIENFETVYEVKNINNSTIIQKVIQ